MVAIDVISGQEGYRQANHNLSRGQSTEAEEKNVRKALYAGKHHERKLLPRGKAIFEK